MKKGKKLLTFIVALAVVLTTVLGSVPAQADGTTSEPYLMFHWGNQDSTNNWTGPNESSENTELNGAVVGNASPIYFYLVDANGNKTNITYDKLTTTNASVASIGQVYNNVNGTQVAVENMTMLSYGAVGTAEICYTDENNNTYSVAIQVVDSSAPSITGPALAFRWSGYDEATNTHFENVNGVLETEWGAPANSTSPMFFYYIDSNGDEVRIDDASLLSSSDTDIIDITADGTVTGLFHVELKSEGTADIIYNHNGTNTYSVTIHVQPAVDTSYQNIAADKMSATTVEHDRDLLLNDRFAFEGRVLTYYYFTDNLGGEVENSLFLPMISVISSDPSIAEVCYNSNDNHYEVLAKSLGDATITITYDDLTTTDNTVTASQSFTVSVKEEVYNLSPEYHGEGTALPGEKFSVTPTLVLNYLDENNNSVYEKLSNSEYVINATTSNAYVTPSVANNVVTLTVSENAIAYEECTVTLSAMVNGEIVATEEFWFDIREEYYVLNYTGKTNPLVDETISTSDYELVYYKTGANPTTVTNATFTFAGYDSAVWELDAATNTLTRISEDSGYVEVVASIPDPVDTTTSINVANCHKNFDSIYAWARIDLPNGNDIFDNADTEAALDTGWSVDLADVAFTFELGNEDENGFSPFSTQTGLYTLKTDSDGMPTSIVFHGAALKGILDAGEMNGNGFAVKITTKLGGKTYNEETAWINLRNTDPEYMSVGDWQLLTTQSNPIWSTIDFMDYMGTYYSMPVNNVAVTGGDTDCLQITYIADQQLWDVKGLKPGTAEVTITHENPDDANAPMTCTFEVVVADVFYEFWIHSDGEDRMFPTAQKTVSIEMGRQFIDENGMFCSEPFEDYTVRVESTGDNSISATVNSNGLLTINTTNTPVGDYRIELVASSDGVDIAARTYEFGVRETYYAISPVDLANIATGETVLKSAFTVNYYDANNTANPVLDVTNNVTIDYIFDQNHWTENADGSGFIRTTENDTDIHVEVYVHDESVASRNYHFSWLEASAYIFFGPADCVVYQNENITYPMNVNTSVDSSKVTVVAEIGTGEHDNFVAFADQSKLSTVAKDASGDWTITFNGTELNTLFEAGQLEADTFVVKTTAYISGTEYQSEYVRMRLVDTSPVYDSDRGRIEDADGMISETGIIPSQVLYRKYDGTEYTVTVTNVVSDSAAVRVVKTTNQEMGTFWALYFEEEGLANITLTHEDPENSGQTIEFTFKVMVVKHRIGHGHEMLSGYEQHAFPGDVSKKALYVSYEYYDEEANEIISKDITDVATYNWFFQPSDSTAFTCTSNGNVGTITVANTAAPYDHEIHYGCDITYTVDGDVLWSAFEDTLYVVDEYPLVGASPLPSTVAYGATVDITPKAKVATYDVTTGNVTYTDISSAGLDIYMSWHTPFDQDVLALACDGEEIPYGMDLKYDPNATYTVTRGAFFDAAEDALWVRMHAVDPSDGMYIDIGEYHWTLSATTCPHTDTVVLDKSDATCTDDGYTGDTYCNICDTITNTGSVIPAPGHSYTSVVTAPTCTDKGYTTHTCTCGDSYTDADVPALGHDTVLQNDKAATCTVDGYTGDLYCTTCKTVTEKGEVIPAPGHRYTSVITDPTCTDKGYTTHTCTCGDSYTDTEVAALGHDTVLQNDKAATCTVDGYTGDTFCTTCETTLEKGAVIPATGHSHKSTLVPATCTVAGTKTYTCACGDTYTETIQPDGHIYSAGACTVCQTADPNYKPATEVEAVVSQTTQQEAAKATEDITNTVSDTIKEAKAEAAASGETLSTEKLVETVKEALTESKDKDVKAVVDAVSEETMEKIIVAVEEEKEIITTVVVQPVSDEVIAQMAPKDVEKIEKFAGNHSVVAQYLDLSVLIQAKDADGNVETLGTVDEPTKPMTFTLSIPTELQKDGRTFYIILVHDDGAAERVKVTNNGDGTISFKANKFSTYALAYTDAVAPVTGDMFQTVPMATYIVLGAAVAALLASIRLKRAVRVR